MQLMREVPRSTGAAPSLREPGDPCPRVIYFRSDSCVSCETQARLWTQLDERVRTLIEPVDVEAEPDRAKAYNILTLPTSLVVDPSGRVVHINYGVVPPAKLLHQLESALHSSGSAAHPGLGPGPVCELIDTT